VLGFGTLLPLTLCAQGHVATKQSGDIVVQIEKLDFSDAHFTEATSINVTT
jgi:hypothetical protein